LQALSKALGSQGSGYLAPGDAAYGSSNSLFIGGYAEHATCSADMLAANTDSSQRLQRHHCPWLLLRQCQMLVEHVGTADWTSASYSDPGFHKQDLASPNRLKP
jgi:hypothetical protein